MPPGACPYDAVGMQRASHSSAVLRLVDELFAAPVLTISRAQALLGVTFRAAQLTVEKLEKEGKGCQFWLLSKYRLRQARGRETANDLNALVQLIKSWT